MSGEAPTAETPTEHASGAAPATGGAAAVPEPSGDERNPIASGSILGIRSDVPGTSDEERPSGGDVQGSYEPTAGAKRHKKSTPQSITQQALEATLMTLQHKPKRLQNIHGSTSMLMTSRRAVSLMASLCRSYHRSLMV